MRLVLTHLADDVATEPRLTHSADDVKKWAHLAGGRGSDGPCGMAYDADNAKLYVSDTGLDQVFAIQLNNLGMPVGCTSFQTLHLHTHRCCGPGALCLHQGKLYVAGGTNRTGTIEATAEAFDPRQNRWEPVAPMATGRRCMGAAM